MRPLLLAFISLITALMLSSCASDKKFNPEAKNGVIDLSQWDFRTDGAVKLDGEWEFYWMKLLSPEDFQQGVSVKPDFIKLPSIWNGYKYGDHELSGEGYATFRLTLKVHDLNELFIKMMDVASAHRVWLNSKMIASNGIVGDESSFQPEKHPTTGYSRVSRDQKQVELIIQVANYSHRKGGIWYSILAGSEHQILKEREYQAAIDMLLIGCLLIIGFNHFAIFALRRNDLSTLYFGIFCVLISLRVFSTGENLISHYFNISWELNYKLEYLSMYAGLTVFTAFFYELFPEYMVKKALRVLQGIGVALSLLVIMTPASIYSYSVIFFQAITVGWFLYCFWILIYSVYRKKPGSGIYLFGWVLFFLGFINDVLYQNEILQTGNWSPIIILIFIFIQSFTISSNFSRAFTEIELLQGMFRKFVPQRFLSYIAKEGIQSIQIGNAENIEISVLFSDIRSFTHLSEMMTPQEVLNFLNGYFKRMNKPIHENQGVIDKFIGDAIMALFERSGNLNPVTGKIGGAIQAGIDMIDALKIYNKHRSNHNYPPVAIGIGIHSGPVIIGTVGSEDRMDSTALGDVVNLASRLEGLTKLYECNIIVSESTLKLVTEEEGVLSRKLDYVSVKGKERPVSIYEIYNNDDEELRHKKQFVSNVYHEAIDEYLNKNWKKSKEMFEKVLETLGTDKVCEMYIQRCREYLEHAPDADWDGVFRLNVK